MSSLLANADSNKLNADNHLTEAILRLIDELALPYLSERSVKCFPGHWLPQRRLFSLPVGALSTNDVHFSLKRLLFELEMPSHSVEECLSPFLSPEVDQPLPHYLHLGVEGDRCKIYWETKRPESVRRDARFVLYRAWKWRADEPAARSDYVLLPTAHEARLAIEQELTSVPACPVHDVIEQLQVSFALQKSPWPPLTVKIEEIQEGCRTGRDSLNLHLHSASLPLGAIAGTMFSLARDWQSASRDTLITWMARHGNKILSNLSFGHNESGQPFLTCYYGTTRHSPRKNTLKNSDCIPSGTLRALERSTPIT